MVKAVLFDVGSTLVLPRPDIDGVFFEMATLRGHSLAKEAVSACLGEVNDFYEKEYLRDGDFWCSPTGSVEIYLEMYRYLAHLLGLEHDAQGIAHAVWEAYLKPQYWQVISDVVPCLKSLRHEHLRLGIVSNWAPNLADLIRGLLLAPYFESVIASADVGYRKPDPIIFEIALERMGIAPEEALHVGDRPDVDGIGAQKAGIMPIIIDRTGAWQDCPFMRIGSLAELPGIAVQARSGRLPQNR
ncbi:MAG: HAD-IA family hydrolase [Coriobacteriaceae bacterium]|jgi:putative hydrolase of the HAD superfamily|nr:HAD-IA family hydrolase [Coriobacteriaceae bacterium]